jgi:hypothetical protein
MDLATAIKLVWASRRKFKLVPASVLSCEVRFLPTGINAGSWMWSMRLTYPG